MVKQQKAPIPLAEAVIMLTIAVIIDVLGLIFALAILVFGSGIVLSYIADFLGIIFIGIWAWSRTGRLPLTQRLTRFTTRFGVAAIGELIPVVGALPLWTLYVLFAIIKSRL